MERNENVVLEKMDITLSDVNEGNVNNQLPERNMAGKASIGNICPPSSKSISEILDNLVEHVKANSPAEAAGAKEGISLSEKVLVVITSEFVIKTAQEKNWDLARFQDDFYAFNGEYWVKVQKDEMKRFLGLSAERINVDRYTARHYSFKKALLSQFYETGFLKQPIVNEYETKINLCNGTLVLSADKRYLRPFDSKDFFLYKLSFPYDPKASAPIFQKFLDRVLPSNGKQMVLAESIGYAFIKNKVLKLEKSALLLGTGANGKSVVFDVINGMLGSENVSNIPLQNLTDPKNYSRTQLAGKILNYASEISTKINPVEFKTLVSGEPITVRMIYERPFTLTNYARLMFNTNELPENIEKNHAFIRRLNIIEFKETIPQNERDSELANKIISSELSGVFNWVLEGMDRLLKNKAFTKCDEVDKAIERYRLESNPAHMFLEENGYKPSTENKTYLNQLYTSFKTYCRENGYSGESNISFSKRIQALGYGIKKDGPGKYFYMEK